MKFKEVLKYLKEEIIERKRMKKDKKFLKAMKKLADKGSK